MIYVIFKSQAEAALGKLKFHTMPLSTEGCTYEFELNNSTIADKSHVNEMSLHNISYLYYTCKILVFRKMINNF